MNSNLKKGIAITLAAGLLTTAASAGIRDQIKERFQSADTNGDGTVTHQEMMAKVTERFGDFDKNGDGFLELNELPKNMPMPEGLEQRVKKRMEKMAKRNPEMSNEMKELMKERFSHRSRRMNFVAKLDRDGDERVSVDEFASRKIRQFKRADQNGDGNVTMAEVKDTLKDRMRSMHRKMGRRSK